ncbi:hypothetical protein BH581_15775 [Vibrio splendidus]|uniref:hypothetical protein n=1 Tax=Vibrio splendidus TaxID=29497 RepID=UPI00097873DF|nr:hypothetical protein [Vibrio splendidus]OMO25430.1 hypothetical protein BH581_15775 [Vibrio splendidus]PMK06939.1 hypothetical protein BCU10_21910 [Vibrio splendidus]
MNRKFWMPILLTLFVIINIGLISGLATKSTYKFEAEYPMVGWEKISLRLENGRVKMQYIGYDIDGNIAQTKQMFGVFLRWGNHYYFYQLDQDQAQDKQTFNIKHLYIQQTQGKRSVLVSNQRGLYVTKKGTPLELKGIMHGDRLR